ncbi:hypothetical protein QG37_03506 [Candidozyma auris]|uniref:Uncharacterized protein n=1 Tax=Candidozyma auris TaxID=498019 RepID=A0A0L0NZD7_CANAR|nr:hypothetical protein QG37_03506 [[Candida] auris]
MHEPLQIFLELAHTEQNANFPQKNQKSTILSKYQQNLFILDPIDL